MFDLDKVDRIGVKNFDLDDESEHTDEFLTPYDGKSVRINVFNGDIRSKPFPTPDDLFTYLECFGSVSANDMKKNIIVDSDDIYHFTSERIEFTKVRPLRLCLMFIIFALLTPVPKPAVTGRSISDSQDRRRTHVVQQQDGMRFDRRKSLSPMV